VKLADLGLSKTAEEISDPRVAVTLPDTINWTAPELFAVAQARTIATRSLEASRIKSKKGSRVQSVNNSGRNSRSISSNRTSLLASEHSGTQTSSPKNSQTQ
jgi:hypothetical protein